MGASSPKYKTEQEMKTELMSKIMAANSTEIEDMYNEAFSSEITHYELREESECECHGETNCPWQDER